MVIAFFLRLSSLLFLTFTPFAVRYLMLQVSDVEFITHYKKVSEFRQLLCERSE